jgi:integral membrane protein (TIGR01906 family)
VNKIYATILSWLTTLLTPLFLLGISLRLLLTPLFLQIEYRMPYFPPDEYGFSTQDRLHYAPYAMQYLLKRGDTNILTGQRFPDGTPLYNERELSHMQDVKTVTQSSLILWYTSILLLLTFGLWAKAGKWWQAYLYGLKRGGWLIIGLVFAVGLFAGLAFWQFFTLFHSLFFEGDTWLFLFSDTLIRLFPIRFWQDVFLSAGLLTLGGGFGLAFGVKPGLPDSTVAA